jgi:ASC-1-like (ASCH) protein
MFEVLELHQYASFYELLKAESSEKVFPGTKTVEEGKLFSLSDP